MFVLGSQVFNKGGWQPGFGSREGARAGSLFPLSGFLVSLSRSVPKGEPAESPGEAAAACGKKEEGSRLAGLEEEEKKNKPIRELRRASKQGYRLGWIGD